MRHDDDCFDLDSSPELLHLAEEVRTSGKPRALRRNGEVLAVLRPFPSRGAAHRTLSEQDIEDFRASAGSWAGIDLGAFLSNVYSARDVPEDRPPVDL